MGLFSDPKEIERKRKLKELEDKRLAFAQKLHGEGFAPAEMLFLQTPNGGFAALCEFKNRNYLILSPGFGADDDFVIECTEGLSVAAEEVFVASEGLAGVLGMGKKGQTGYRYMVTLSSGNVAEVPVVCGSNAWMTRPLKKNPLLENKRRRGDPNIVWDMRPVEKHQVQPLMDQVEKMLGVTGK